MRTIALVLLVHICTSALADDGLDEFITGSWTYQRTSIATRVDENPILAKGQTVVWVLQQKPGPARTFYGNGTCGSLSGFGMALWDAVLVADSSANDTGFELTITGDDSRNVYAGYIVADDMMILVHNLHARSTDTVTSEVYLLRRTQ